jgi:hypothetical protein
MMFNYKKISACEYNIAKNVGSNHQPLENHTISGHSNARKSLRASKNNF